MVEYISMRILRYLLLTLAILAMPLLLAGISFEAVSTPEASIPVKEKRISGRGVYITAYTAQNADRLAYIKRVCKAHNLDTICVDAKDMISQPFTDLIKQRKLTADTKAIPSPWLTKLTEELHESGFIVTARCVAFKDDRLLINRPDLSIKLPGGAMYRDKKQGRWANPYRDEVRLYNALIAESAAASGVDEIQFDYIRFPAEGAAANLTFPEEEETSRVEIICQFLAEVKKRTDPYNASLAADIFGVTAWQSVWDVETLGQSLEAMAKYLDVLSPMFYPSHFHRGYDGFANPGSEPYYFVNTGVKKALEILGSSEAKTKLVPWIQGFNMLSPNYGPGYIKAQAKACEDEGVEGFLIWNARNVYDNLPADL